MLISISLWISQFVDPFICWQISSVQLSCSLVSDSLWPHGLQHTRHPCPSPTPGVYSNSCPSRWWCYPIISSSVIPFFFHLKSFPAPGSFQMRQFFSSVGQSTGISASASVLPMNFQNWFSLGWTGWISSPLLLKWGTEKYVALHSFKSACRHKEKSVMEIYLLSCLQCLE